MSVTSLAADQSGSFSYTVHVRVQTTGTGPVTVVLTVAGSSTLNTPGSVGTQVFTVPLRGQTSYDVSQKLDDHTFCPAPYLGVRVTASGAPETYRDASSSC